MARRKLVQAPEGDGAILVASGVVSGTAGNISRLTALDVNHLHAWELDDASGNFVDTGSSSSKVNLTVTGTPIYGCEGPFGSCVQFGLDATGSANTNHGRELVSAFVDLPSTNVTLEAWVQSYTPSMALLFGVDSVGANNFNVDGNSSSSGQLAATVRATSFTNMSSISTLGASYGFAWQHIALVYNGTYQYLYLNGEVVARGSNTGNVNWSNGTTPRFCLARGQNAAGQFYGKMCRVRLSNIARSQSYLRTVYATGMGF